VRSNSFFGRVLTDVARSGPASSPVRRLTTDTRTARSASRLLMAIGRTTPAFTPGSYHVLDSDLKASWQLEAGTSIPQAATEAGNTEDLIEFGSWIPSERRRRASYSRALVVALAAFAISAIVASGLIVKAALHPGTATYPAGAVSASASPKAPKASPSALMKALIVTNNSADAKGLLPPSSCQQQGSDKVTCTNPALGISGVVFQTYPSLNALYNAYVAELTSLNSGKFKENFNDCQSQVTHGEVAWNHLFQHPKIYTVNQMVAGKVADSKAAGRVFCNYTQGNEYMVWTQNDGHLLGVVAGPVNSDVWNWWLPIHQNIGLSNSSASSSPGAATSKASRSTRCWSPP